MSLQRLLHAIQRLFIACDWRILGPLDQATSDLYDNGIIPFLINFIAIALNLVLPIGIDERFGHLSLDGVGSLFTKPSNDSRILMQPCFVECLRVIGVRNRVKASFFNETVRF